MNVFCDYEIFYIKKKLQLRRLHSLNLVGAQLFITDKQIFCVATENRLCIKLTHFLPPEAKSVTSKHLTIDILQRTLKEKYCMYSSSYYYSITIVRYSSSVYCCMHCWEEP